MTFRDGIRAGISRLIRKASEHRAARQEKAESDTAADAANAGSRAGRDGDGHYVGRTTPQFDAEDRESGAEARSDAARRSDKPS